MSSRLAQALLIATLGVAGLPVWTPPALAQSRSADVVRAHLEGLGAAVREVPARVFLQQGEARVVAHEVDGTGCVGFVAFGAGAVRDVDLRLHTEGGLLLDEDTTSAPYGYVRGCSRARQTWFLDIRMYAGRGELVLLRVEDAPTSIDLLPFELGLAAPSGGRPEAPRAVGPGLPGRTLEQRFIAEESEWVERGYMPAGPLRQVPVASGLARAVIPLEAGLCYAIVVGGVHQGRTAVVVAGTGEERWSGSSTTGRAVTHVCPDKTAEHNVFVKIRAGGGNVLMRSYVQPDAALWESPVTRGDSARVIVGELHHKFAARGMKSGVVGDGWLDTVGPLLWPITLSAGHCYGMGIVPLSGSFRGSLELALEDADRRLLARDRRSEEIPVIYHCPAESGQHRALIRSVTEVGPVVVVVAEWSAEDRRRVDAGH
jgi:hypothetical protein